MTSRISTDQSLMVIPLSDLETTDRKFRAEKVVNIQAEFLDSPEPLAHTLPDTFIQTGIFSTPKLQVCLYGLLDDKPALVCVSPRKTSYDTIQYRQDRQAAGQALERYRA